MIIIVSGITLFLPEEEEIPKKYYFVLLMIVFGAGMVYALYFLFRFFLTYKWKIAYGEILQSEVLKIDDSESTIYKFIFKYRYRIENAEYLSDSLYPFKFYVVTSFKSIASRVAERYKPGMRLEIFYNPSHPEKSFIERKGLTIILLVLIFFSAMFSLMLSAFLGIIDL